jgi:hypothetical protein
MVFPPLLHRLQVKYFNPTIMALARHAPGFATKTGGRRSAVAAESHFHVVYDIRTTLNLRI